MAGPNVSIIQRFQSKLHLTHFPHTKVFYCGRECQTLAWTVGNHQKLCKIWTAKSEAEKDAAAKQIKPSED